MEKIIIIFNEIKYMLETNTYLRIAINLITGVIGLILVFIMFNSIINTNKKKIKKSNNNSYIACSQKDEEQLRHISEWDYDYLKNYLDAEMIKHPHELSCDIATVLMDYKNDGDEYDKEIRSICEQYSTLRSSYERKIKSLNEQINSAKTEVETIRTSSNNALSKLEQQNALLQNENTNLREDNSHLINDVASLMKENEYLHKSYDRVLEETNKPYNSIDITDEPQGRIYIDNTTACEQLNINAFNNMPDEINKDSKDKEIVDNSHQTLCDTNGVHIIENNDYKSFDEIYDEAMHNLEKIKIKTKYNLKVNNVR